MGTDLRATDAKNRIPTGILSVIHKLRLLNAFPASDLAFFASWRFALPHVFPASLVSEGIRAIMDMGM